jgi:hypothetical protein
MNNGLDALAALCGATGRVQTETEVAAPSPAGGSGAQVVTGAHSSGTLAPQPCTAPLNVPVNVNPQQQLQQVMGFGNAANPFAATSVAAIMHAAQQPTLGDPASINAMQQLAYYQYIQFAAQAASLQAQVQTVTGDCNLTTQHQQQQQSIPFDVTKSAVPFNFSSAASPLSQKLGTCGSFGDFLSVDCDDLSCSWWRYGNSCLPVIVTDLLLVIRRTKKPSGFPSFLTKCYLWNSISLSILDDIDDV